MSDSYLGNSGREFHGFPVPLMSGPGVCRVRRRFSVGASPTRQLSLQPEAVGAVMEVTKWLKPLM